MRYKQLLVAVHSGVVGAEIWVLAQVQLDKQIDIPPAATAICCGSVDEEQLVSGLHLKLLAVRLTSSQTIIRTTNSLAKQWLRAYWYCQLSCAMCNLSCH